MDEILAREIAGQLSSGKAALIVVDVQNDFCHPQGVFGKRGFDLSRVEASVDTLVAFIGECRRHRMPVVFVRTIHSDWSDCDSWRRRLKGAGKDLLNCRPDSWGAEFYKICPLSIDFIVTKHRLSAFFASDLNLVLRSRGVETLLMTGVATNVCVETTARDAVNLDYRVILVEDCCGAFSDQEHASAITNISEYFGTVIDSKTVLDIMDRIT